MLSLDQIDTETIQFLINSHYLFIEFHKGDKRCGINISKPILTVRTYMTLSQALYPCLSSHLIVSKIYLF